MWSHSWRLTEQSEPRQFCKPPLPFPPRVLKEHRSVFLKVTAQDVGRDRVRQAGCQAGPASLHHLLCASTAVAPLGLSHSPGMGETEPHSLCGLGDTWDPSSVQANGSDWMSPFQEGWGWCQRTAWNHPLPQGRAWLPVSPQQGHAAPPYLGNSISVVGARQEQKSPLRQKQIHPFLNSFSAVASPVWRRPLGAWQEGSPSTWH